MAFSHLCLTSCYLPAAVPGCRGWSVASEDSIKSISLLLIMLGGHLVMAVITIILNS